MKARFIIIAILSCVILSSAFQPPPKAKKQQVKKVTVVDSVLICATGEKYHLTKCRGLSKCNSGIEKISKSNAVEQGYTACKICY